MHCIQLSHARCNALRHLPPLLPPAQQEAQWLAAAAGRVWLPASDEQAALDASPSTPGVWKGCVIGEHALMDGQVLAVLGGVGSPEGCCRACFSDSLRGAGNRTCNVFNHCADDGGCRCSLL